MAASEEKSIFADLKTFPPFSCLPEDDAVVDRDSIIMSFISAETSPHTVVSIDATTNYKTPLREPSRTWCFVAEIVDADPDSPIRRSILIKDRSGDELCIYFHPESGTFDYTTLENGHTVAIMFAERHHFRDLTIGIRLENLDTIKVIKCSLDDLFDMGSFYAKRGEERCWNMECEELKPPELLIKCSSCKCARYCEKKCQTTDWDKRHHRWCKALPMLMKLASIDYSKVTTMWPQ